MSPFFMGICFTTNNNHMGKSKYYFGQSILGQVLKLIPSSIVSKSTKSHVQIRMLDELPLNLKYTTGDSNDHEFLKHLQLA
jgi:hypothetical protein